MKVVYAWRMPALCLGVIAALLGGGCVRDSYRNKLSGPVDIGSDWVTFEPETPLRADKDMQWVLLELEPPFKDNTSLDPGTVGGIYTPDGEVINPEIEVVDQDGNVFKLGWSGTRGGAPGYHLPSPEKLPCDRAYKTVRIRSPRPIRCKAVYWFCDSTKDWK